MRGHRVREWGASPGRWRKVKSSGEDAWEQTCPTMRVDFIQLARVSGLKGVDYSHKVRGCRINSVLVGGKLRNVRIISQNSS